MLVRKQNGSTFHIVCGETRSHFVCLCGERVFKNSLSQQRCADGPYVRCWRCRRLEHERLAASPNLKVY